MTNDCFYYIPIEATLKRLLEKPEVLAEVKLSHPESGCLHDFCYGSLFKENPFFQAQQNALQIIGYYDELEVCNPLGSYVKKHKMGCLFFSLGNIRPRKRSSLKAIYLVALSKSALISKYGINAFLKPFVDELTCLRTSGVTVVVNGGSEVFYGSLFAMLADTLAAHTLGGFKEGMGFSLRMCRLCMATKSNAQVRYLEKDLILRDPRSHAMYCHQIESGGPLKDHFSICYGINRLSELERINDYSVTYGMPHDLMHDLFEGIVPYEMQCFLKYGVSQSFFTIAQLNKLLSSFHFGYSEISDKPTLFDANIVKDVGTQKIRQSASQMILLTRVFPVILGDLIPEDDPNWASLLLLFRIALILLSPICSANTAAYLTVFIEEKLSSFRKLYPNKKLIPKFHYLIHYPSQLLKYGPAILCWTMRHEAKLSFVKRCAKFANFKNFCLTTAKKHQRWLCYELQSEKFLEPSVQIGPVKSSVFLQSEDLEV